MMRFFWKKEKFKKPPKSIKVNGVKCKYEIYQNMDEPLVGLWLATYRDNSDRIPEIRSGKGGYYLAAHDNL